MFKKEVAHLFWESQRRSQETLHFNPHIADVSNAHRRCTKLAPPMYRLYTADVMIVHRARAIGTSGSRDRYIGSVNSFTQKLFIKKTGLHQCACVQVCIQVSDRSPSPMSISLPTDQHDKNSDNKLYTSLLSLLK